MTRDELIEKNLGLVHACAKRFKDKGIEYDDLYSAGVIGLIKAVDRFDPDLGYQFSTYAVPVILGEIKRLFRDGGAVKISRPLKELSQKAKRISDMYLKETGEEISVSLLSERLGESTEKTALALSAAYPVLSLSADEDTPQITVVTESHEDKLIERLSLKQALSSLSQEESALIMLRYFRHQTQSETAKVLGTTQVQISRREKKILRKLKMMLI